MQLNGGAMPGRSGDFNETVLNEGVERFVTCEQSRSLYSNLYVIPAGGIIAASVILIMSFGKFPSVHLLAWWVLACFFSLMHWFIGKKAHSEADELQNCVFWLHIHTLRSFCSGCAWGLLWIFFVGGDLSIYTLFLCIIYTGYIAGSASSCASYSPSFHAILIPASLPLMGRAFFEGGAIYSGVGVMVLLFASAMYFISLSTQRQFKEGCKANFNNLVLMEQLVKQKAIAEEAANAKTRFLAAASHDLRQPFSAMNLLLGALVDPETNKVRPHVLSKIHGSFSILNDMLHDILDISRLDSKSVEQNVVHIRVNDTIHQLVDQTSIELLGKEVSIYYSPNFNVVVKADKSLFRRLLHNILDNAIKYTEKGFICIDCARVGEKISISISDTGIGIPEGELNNIFEEFYQLGNPQRDRQMGIGLGLAIVNRLCARMGVELGVESTLGEGTVFTMMFDRGSPKSVQENDSLSLTSETDLAGVKVIAVDDSEEILDGLRLIFSDWGCLFLVEPDLERVIRSSMSQNFVPDILVVDYRLEGQLDGLEVIEELRTEFNKHVPAILITGDTSPAKIDSVSASDAVVLYKPIEPEVLLAEMKALLT